MTPRQELAGAARRVAAARRQADDVPPLDADAWDALLRRVVKLQRAGDTYNAVEAVAAWEAAELRACEVTA